MRIGVAATPDVAIPTLDWLLQSEHEVVLVISRPDRPAGRGRELTSSAVSNWAIAHQIALLRPQSADELVGVIDDLDLVITIGYGVLIPLEILRLPKYGFINLHFSLLPAYRGAAPVQRALENRERITGVTVFALDKGMDTGPIYSSAQIEIDPTWRAGELLTVLAKMGPTVIGKALTAIAVGTSARAQTGSASKANKISKAEAQINWSQPSTTIEAKIKAFFPAPGAWTMWNGGVFKITRAQSIDVLLPPGRIQVLDSQVHVGCGDSASLQITSVVPAGKREMSALDWARGARLTQGACFG